LHDTAGNLHGSVVHDGRKLTFYSFLAFVTDKRSVGGVTSQLQDDAARIQAFSGEPVRAMVVALSSVLIGLTLSFVVGSLYGFVCVCVLGRCALVPGDSRTRTLSPLV
jgi:hypothetical protein